METNENIKPEPAGVLRVVGCSACGGDHEQVNTFTDSQGRYFICLRQLLRVDVREVSTAPPAAWKADGRWEAQVKQIRDLYSWALNARWPYHKAGDETVAIGDLLGYIDHLRATLAATQEAAAAGERWIPVTERLPEGPGRYAVTVQTEEGPEAHALELNEKKQWIYEGEPTFCLGYYFEPTHWQPLPPPHV